MIDPSNIREHMEVVGSDGKHVGTVDHLALKLTKADPSADGRHHFLNIETAASVEGDTVKLSIPASEAMQQAKALRD